MVCGHPLTSLPTSSAISWHRVAAQCPTSKVIWKLISLTESSTKMYYIFPVPDCLTSGRQHSAVNLSMCITITNCVYELYQSTEERESAHLPMADIECGVFE